MSFKLSLSYEVVSPLDTKNTKIQKLLHDLTDLQVIYDNFLGMFWPMAMVTEPKETGGQFLVKKVLLSLITCLGNRSVKNPII